MNNHYNEMSNRLRDLNYLGMYIDHQFANSIAYSITWNIKSLFILDELHDKLQKIRNKMWLRGITQYRVIAMEHELQAYEVDDNELVMLRLKGYAA